MREKSACLRSADMEEEMFPRSDIDLLILTEDTLNGGHKSRISSNESTTSISK